MEGHEKQDAVVMEEEKGEGLSSDACLVMEEEGYMNDEVELQK